MALKLLAEHIVKRYGGVVAVRDGSIEITSGNVVTLVGANGSGKSTLSKVITGVVVPNEGQLLLNGEPIHFSDPQAAKKHGITAVYQELSLIPDMTVAENIWLTHEPRRAGFSINRGEMRARTQDLLALFEGTVSQSLAPDTLVNTLPPDERQIVEILKAISGKPHLVIFDEATASLDRNQVNRLFDLIQQWKREGMAIVLITHRMDEIFRVADRVTVMRNGRTVGTVDIEKTSAGEILEMMIEGAASPEKMQMPSVAPDAPVRLEVNNLRAGRLQGIDLMLRDGELLGLGGLQGQGQTDLLLALFGALTYTGTVILGGKQAHFQHPRDAMQQAVAFVPGDRGSEGLLLTRSIMENFLLPSWRRFGVLHDTNTARQTATKAASDLSLVYSSLDAPASSLSGGNAQKVVIGKWLLRDPKLLLLNDPTKGVDVGAKGEFYALLRDLTAQGTAILFYSSDDDELLGLCNRVLVLQDGHVRDELSGERLTRSNLVAASMGTTDEQR